MNTEKTVINYFVKNVYGNYLIYPVNFKNELFNLTNKKTLSRKDIESLSSMGFLLREVLESEVK